MPSVTAVSVGGAHNALTGDPNSPDPLRDITIVDNGAYRAKAGWDACTGRARRRGAAPGALSERLACLEDAAMAAADTLSAIG